jgi:hypothetical protein
VRRQFGPPLQGAHAHDAVNVMESKYTERARREHVRQRTGVQRATWEEAFAASNTCLQWRHHGDQEMTSMRVFIRAATGLFVLGVRYVLEVHLAGHEHARPPY